jgi:serine/threonine-protein kinase RsbW
VTFANDSDADEDASSERVGLALPGSVDLVVLARFTAATVAARANFDLDEIEDLRLAVDELCISFGPVEENRSIHLEFERAGNLVRITSHFEPFGSSVGGDPAERNPVDWKRTYDLSRQLLDALVDAHGREDGDGGLCAWVEKRGSVASA